MRRHRTDPGLVIKVSCFKLIKSFKQKQTNMILVSLMFVCPSVRRSGVGGSVRSCGPKTSTMVKEGGRDGDRLRPQHHWWIQTFSPFFCFFFSPCSSRAGRRFDAVSLSKMGLTS